MRKINYRQLIFLILLVVAYFGVKEYREYQKSSEFNEAAFRQKDISYSKHAECRMNCREISEEEVENILKYGQINYSKSNENDSPCPSYALEGRTYDGQVVRIIFGDCEQNARVITSIDLEQEHQCNCP